MRDAILSVGVSSHLDYDTQSDEALGGSLIGLDDELKL